MISKLCSLTSKHNYRHQNLFPNPKVWAQIWHMGANFEFSTMQIYASFAYNDSWKLWYQTCFPWPQKHMYRNQYFFCVCMGFISQDMGTKGYTTAILN